MSPRKYQMTRRSAAAEQTRARIVDATVVAHRELGIDATSWDEIARRAGVGVGTVYRHFPSLDQLLPACGEVVAGTLALPAAGDIGDLFADASGAGPRIERLVAEVFGIYQRGAPFIDNIRRERRQLPQLEEYHRRIEEALDALTCEALQPLTPSRHARDVVRALIDLSAWRAFTDRGFTTDQAIQIVSRLIECSLGWHPSGAAAPEPEDQNHPRQRRRQSRPVV